MEPATPAGFSPGTQWMQLKTHGTGGGGLTGGPKPCASKVAPNVRVEWRQQVLTWLIYVTKVERKPC